LPWHLIVKKNKNIKTNPCPKTRGHWSYGRGAVGLTEEGGGVGRC